MGETPGAARRRSAEQTAVGLGRQQPGVGISISRMSGFVGRYRDDAPDGTAGAARCRRHGPTIGAIGIGVKLTPRGRCLSIAGYA